MAFGLKDCRYCGEGRFDLGDYPTSARIDKSRREEYEQLTSQNMRRVQVLQDKLYAEGREGGGHPPAGDGRRRQGLHDQARHERGQPPGRRGAHL